MGGVDVALSESSPDSGGQKWRGHARCNGLMRGACVSTAQVVCELYVCGTNSVLVSAAVVSDCNRAGEPRREYELHSGTVGAMDACLDFGEGGGERERWERDRINPRGSQDPS